MNRRCYECGKQIGDRAVTMPGIPASFCDVECYKKHCNGKDTAEIPEEVHDAAAKAGAAAFLKRQAKPEIKQKAWELFLRLPRDEPRSVVECWHQAERFYEYAKEKEGEKDA